MLDWIKNIGKKHPEFWNNYLAKFKTKSHRYVILSIETTGTNPKEDVILSIAGIAMENNSLLINDTFEATIPQYKYLNANKLTNDFFQASALEKMTESDAIEKFIDYIGNATLIGFRINIDIEIINNTLEKYDCGRLKNNALDIEMMHKKLHDINDKDFTIYDLAKIYKIPVNDRNSTADDAFTTGLLFLKLKQKLKI